MISEADKDNAEELPSLAELRHIAETAKDNETKAQALCLAAGLAQHMSLPVVASRLMARAATVAACDGVKPETRRQIALCASRLSAALVLDRGRENAARVDEGETIVIGEPITRKCPCGGDVTVDTTPGHAAIIHSAPDCLEFHTLGPEGFLGHVTAHWQQADTAATR